MIGHDPISWVAAAGHIDTFDLSEITAASSLASRTAQVVEPLAVIDQPRLCGSDCAQRETGGASAMNSRQ